MPNPVVYAYPEGPKVSDSLAEFIVRVQDQTLASKKTFDVAVSGGSLVGVLSHGLLKRSDVKWSNWRIFFSDERIVPLNNEDSNYGLVKKELLGHLNSTKQPCPQVYTLDERLSWNSSADKFASSYEQMMVSVLGEKPIFDLVLLGCGPDGHTCSLFAGHKLLKEKERLVAGIEDSPKPPPRRITITLPVLADAENIAFVAEGSSKASILKRVFEHPEDKLPSSQVNQIAKSSVAWFVDDSAIEGVKVVRSFL